jgi:hypothetical protein
MACGTAIAIAALQLPVGKIARPGPGLFPLLLGLLLASLGLALLLEAVGAKTLQAKAFWREPAGRRRVMGTAAALLVYTFAVDPLGFLPTTFLLLVFLFRGVYRLTWIASVGMAVLISVSAHLIFAVWLQVNLPLGLLGT